MNRLATETSPYLRQHADNPVAWHPWGDEAFEEARQRDVPVLVSIGYSSCHWCHVMAHESFEDDQVARVMNDRFVNVKVDREERPDVDAVYMQAVQAMTGGGGWPLTVFVTPDGEPFFGGTYFPKESRQGMPGFIEVLDAVTDAWQNRRNEVGAQAAKLTEAVAQSAQVRPSDEMLTDDILRAGYEQARQSFDPHHGGFGRAPKFPQAMTLDFLLRSYARNRSPETLDMVTTSLDAMASGGIYDHVGGGFHRYSVDATWLVPHFEKMLYDQALLTRLYLHAWQTTGEDRYRRIVEETVGYVLRDLRHPDGGFFSSEDADSEGVEGRFYVWRIDEVRRIAGPDADALISYFGMTPQGNFEGANILFVPERAAPRPPEVERHLPALFEAREQRVRPGLDDKVLLGWNALFLTSLAEAAAVLDRSDWLDAARDSTRFLLDRLRRDDGRLLRSWQEDGGARHLAYAEDHAALLEALVTLAETDHVAWLDDAVVVADALVDLFEDPDAGGFFTVGRDGQQLVARVKDLFDNATPAENSLAANGLLRLAAFTGDDSYRDSGVRVLRLVRDTMARHPTAFSELLGALEWYLTPPIEIAVLGAPERDDTAALRSELWRRHLPATVRVTATPADDGIRTPLLEGRELLGGVATAYVCHHFACQQPVTSPADLARQIDEALAGRP